MGAADVSQSIKSIKEKYIQEKSSWLDKDVHLKRQYQLLAWLRLAFFVGAFSLPFILFVPWSAAFFCVFSLLFVCFIFSVWKATKVTRERKYVSKRLELLEKELSCLNNEWANGYDGAEFIEAEHAFAHDLDLFGKGSLFQYINRTSTEGGLKRLESKLKNLSRSKEDIYQKQEAIKELSGMDAFCQHFFALGALLTDENKKDKKINIENVPDISFITSINCWVFRVFIVYVFVSFLAIAIGWWPGDVILFNLFAGLAISGVYLSKVNRVHSEVSTMGAFLKRYSTLIKLVEDTNFESGYLRNVKTQLLVDQKSASAITKQLATLIERFDLRLNMVMGGVINGFFLWDLFVCMHLKKWYAAYGNSLQKWMDALHEIEALNTFGTFAYNHPQYAYPEVSNSTIIEAEELGHPLISSGERVDNHFSILNDQRISVVTGANMAGKSTFLRTIGVALVLAGNGSVVAARRMMYKPMVFITNMRTVDNLLNHESYFFAELSRLKMIVERLKEDGQLFFILDEILKGTNSLDKTNGSMALIKQLLELNGCGLIATHDLELGQLADTYPKQVFNSCFEVHFKNENLSFDYKLRNGITQSHNATFLMAKMGLIPYENLRN